MTNGLEYVFAALLGVHGAAIIWLCFERDRLLKRIQNLETICLNLRED